MVRVRLRNAFGGKRVLKRLTFDSVNAAAEIVINRKEQNRRFMAGRTKQRRRQFGCLEQCYNSLETSVLFRVR
ncbi:30S ribosomal subunit protein S14 [Candidatus Hodgkinia cicadicola]|nr:30S ribosomal subunit protein S14 [Candidatus Hodgkinia cicadicola]